MKKFWTMTLMVAALVMLAGCCACRTGKNNVALTGTQWHLVRIMGRDLALDSDKFLFTFNNGDFSGIGSCNRLMGKYTLSETGDMKFENLVSTRMMCPNLEMETEFMQILDRATHYEIDGDMLLVLSNGEMQAVLQAAL